MASCKDCVHVDVCEDITRHKLSPSRAEKILPILRERGKTCELFKDRSLLVELPPCKEGDSVYSICSCYGEEDTITEWTVVDIFLLPSKEGGNSIRIRLKYEFIFISILPCELGNRYFLTKEAAEQALNEREENAN